MCIRDRHILKQIPLTYFEKCEQLVKKQKNKFEFDFKQVSSKQKEEILGKKIFTEKVYLHDKTLVKPLSYSR